MQTIFTKIINGKIPCYKIFEDEKVLAFLDIYPDEYGHTLLVPKKQVDKLYDLEDDLFFHIWSVAKIIAKKYEEKLGYRVMFKVVGVDVPHAHIHIIPYDPKNHMNHQEHRAEKASKPIPEQQLEDARQTLKLF